MLETTAPGDLVDSVVFRGDPFAGIPYVFRDTPANHDLLRTGIASVLDIGRDDVVVVGSAKVGFSMDPREFPAPFSAASDVDVVVVNAEHFDHLWQTILSWNYPSRWHLEGFDRQWQVDRREDIYWGYFEPGRALYRGLALPPLLRPIRDYRARWLNAFKGLSRRLELAGLDVKGRLYRTWGHARQYHADGLSKIRAGMK